MVGCDSGIDIPSMDHLYLGISLCSLLDALHDRMDYSYGIEVSPFFYIIFSRGKRADATNFRFFAWYLFGISGCLSPILYSTVNTIVKDDSEERALIMVCQNIIPGCITWVHPVLRAGRKDISPSF